MKKTTERVIRFKKNRAWKFIIKKFKKNSTNENTIIENLTCKEARCILRATNVNWDNCC